MKPWADFHPRVMPYVLGCPIPTVDAALVDMAREFCLNTRCWTVENIGHGFAGQARGEFDIPAGTEILRVLEVTVNGRPYKVKSTSELPKTWRESAPDDCTLYHDTQAEYLIFPAPTGTESIVMKIALAPTYAGTGVDEETFAMYAEAIAAGARAKLQRMPRQEWTDLVQAQIDGAAYISAQHSAANRDFMRSGNHRVQKAGL